MFLPTPLNIPANWNEQFASKNSGEIITQRSDAIDTDINLIVERYTKTGMMPAVQLEAMYGDFSKVGSYKDALELMNAAREEFHTIPAEVRKQFGNDPQAFLNFATDEKNLPKLREMGIAPPPRKTPATLDDVHTALVDLKPKEKADGKTT